MCTYNGHGSERLFYEEAQLNISRDRLDRSIDLELRNTNTLGMTTFG